METIFIQGPILSRTIEGHRPHSCRTSATSCRITRSGKYAHLLLHEQRHFLWTKSLSYYYVWVPLAIVDINMHSVIFSDDVGTNVNFIQYRRDYRYFGCSFDRPCLTISALLTALAVANCDRCRNYHLLVIICYFHMDIALCNLKAKWIFH